MIRRPQEAATDGSWVIIASVAPLRAHDAQQQVENGPARALVEIPRGFVGQHEPRPVDQRARDRHALAFAARKARGLVVGPLGQADRIEQIERPRAALAVLQVT